MYMCPLLCTYSKQAAMMQEQENQKKSEDGQENQSTPSKESLESKQSNISKKKGEDAHGNKTTHKGSKYLKETFERVHKQEVEHEEQNKHLYEKRMQAVNSLKSNIAATQEGLRAQQSKAKALALKKEEEEKQLKESMQNQDIGSVKYLYQLQHLDELKRKREEFEEKLKRKKEAIVAKTLQEEKHGKSTMKDQTKPAKPSTTENMASLAKAKEDLQILLGPRPTSPTERGTTAFGLLHDLSSSSSASSDDEDQEGPTDVEMDQQGPSESLAEPEFSGLWEQQYKPEKPPKEKPAPKEKPIKTRIKLDKPRKAVKRSPFVSKPEVVIFKDFDIGKTYKRKIILTNTSGTTNHLRLLGVTKKLEDFICINFDPPGSVPAGMSCEMQAVFQPLINEDLEGEVNFISSGGSFNLPIRCNTKKCEMEVESEDVDFGPQVLGQVISRTITLTNKGALSTHYSLEIRCPTPKVPSPVSAQACQETGSQNASAGSVCDEAAEEQPQEQEQNQEQNQQAGEASEESHPQNPEEIPDTGVSTEMEAEVEESAPEIYDINLGEIREGDIAPFESTTFEVIFTPTVPGEAKLDFNINFTNPMAKTIFMHAHGVAVSIPVSLVQPNIDLKICMFDCLYQDTVTIQSSATVTLKVTFEVCQEMRKHMEIFPKNGFIQAQSTLNAQLKFQPRHTLAKDAGAYFDSETGVLQVPALLHVSGQVQPIPFAVHAVVTCSDLKFDRAEVDFGYCSIYQSIKNTVRLTNLSLLPQDFGFLNVPKYVEIQPNDGFGTLLPQETLEISLMLSAVKAIDYKFSLHCKSGMNRDFLLSCRGVGVRPPLELSHTLVNFGATAIGDHSTAVIILTNHQSSRFRPKPPDAAGVKDGQSPPRLFSFLLPNNSDITLTPATGRLLPGEKCLIQVTFKPTFLDREIKEEGLRLLQEAALLKQLEEMQLNAEQEQDPKKEVLPEPVKEKKEKKAKSQKMDTSGDQGTDKVSESPTIDDVVEGSELYEQAKTSLLHTFAPRYKEYTIPCFISDGDPPEDNRQAQPAWSPFNTLYLQLQCPAVRPCLQVVSDNELTIIDFHQVSIGDKVIKEFTVQNISDESFQLKSSVLDIFGPFSILNALRIIKPGDQHTLLLAFYPSVDKKFCEVLEIQTPTMNLEVTLRGEGVIPDVTSSHPGGLLDFGYVLEKESTLRVIELHNSSPVAVGFRALLASLCRSKPKGGIEHLNILLGDYTDPELQPVVGTQNYSGANVFSVVPAEGVIGPGQSLNITIVFQPDHPSVYYSDKLTIEIMNKKNLCIIDLKGAASSHNMYLYGGDMLTVPIESLLPPLTDYQTPPSEENDITTPVLVTLRASISEGVITPAVRELKVGCIRSTQSKKSGEFYWDDVLPIQQQGFTVEPLKSNVEPGKEVTITITWSPQSGYKPYEVVQARVLLTVRGDQNNVYSVNLMALVSYSSPSSSPPSPATSVVPM
uniref:Cilia and flagella associated protein 74 n=1 Tax=Cynoglossus semilaevis TaxID=244447 RepID=A0A3P8UU68_CYNSE